MKYDKLTIRFNILIFVDKTGDDTKKEVDKINQQIKENMKTLESKISLQEKSLDGKISKHETLFNEFKSNIKDLKMDKKTNSASYPINHAINNKIS